MLPNTRLFCQRFPKAGMGLKEVSFQTRLCKRGAYSHFPIRDWKTSQSKNHLCGKMELFTHFLDFEASQYTQLECVKEPGSINMWLLFSAAIIVNMCISKICIVKMGVK